MCSRQALLPPLFSSRTGESGSGLAKGARRLKSPMQGGLDLLSVFRYCAAAQGHRGTGPDHRGGTRPNGSVRCGPISPRCSLGYYIAELLTELTDSHDPHPRLFDAAVVTLRRLGDATALAVMPGLFRFELACLRELGLMPSLDECAGCGRVGGQATGDSFAFGLATGGVSSARTVVPGQPHVATLSGHSLACASDVLGCTGASLEATRI